MNQLPNENPKMGGGDKRTPAAKVDIAKREQQIVELRLRNMSFAEIGHTVGVSKQAAVKAFKEALRRNTDADIRTHHRSELAKLEMEEANVWRLMDMTANKDDWKAQAMLQDRLMRIHIRRAKLLGLDAPAKVDVSAFYEKGDDAMSAERLENQGVWQALPIEEQIRIYDALDAAKKRVAIESTATLLRNGTENQNRAAEDPS